jgi:PAS domain-containing protein
MATAEIDRQMAVTSALGSFTTPEYLVTFLHDRWVTPLQNILLREGEESAAWKSILATLNDLLWSVQPKRNPEERRKLVKLLPDLLQRLYASLQEIEWTNDEREIFLGRLVESHATAVKASLASTPAVSLAEAAAIPEATPATATVADGKAAPVATPAENALADGSVAGRATAAAQPAQAPKQLLAGDDHFLTLASNLARGTWIEFAQDGGALVSSKLAWISPLRGNYLFTNRQGRQAFSLSREELAERFRNDLARPVEAEPLLDRALSNLMASLAQPTEEVAPAPG